MKENQVTIRADRLNRPLETCFVGKLSSAVFRIVGDIPDDIDGMTVQIGRTEDHTTHQPRPNYTVAANRNADGKTFRCYLAPFCFPDVSDALEYHVVATDTTGNPRWLGTGQLIVRDNPADGSPVTPEIIPADTYIRNPATGLYHKLTAAVDEDGNLTVALEDEGIER
jgi:hypothetical protein